MLNEKSKPEISKPKRILRPKKSAQKLDIGIGTLYKLVRDGKIPKPIKISERASGFLESWLDDYIDSLVEAQK